MLIIWMEPLPVLEVMLNFAYSLKGYAQWVVKCTSIYRLCFCNHKCVFKILQTDHETVIYIFKKSEIKLTVEIMQNTWSSTDVNRMIFIRRKNVTSATHSICSIVKWLYIRTYNVIWTVVRQRKSSGGRNVWRNHLMMYLSKYSSMAHFHIF